jgi:hypothetical protein
MTRVLHTSRHLALLRATRLRTIVTDERINQLVAIEGGGRVR